MYYAQVVIKSKLKNLNRLYTYKLGKFSAENLVGKRVLVPFGKSNKLIIGFVVSISEETDLKELKDIYDIVDEKELLSSEQIELAKYIAEKYMSYLSSSLELLLPPGDWSDIEEYYWSDENFKEIQELVDFLNTKKTFSDIANKFGNKYNRSELNQLVLENKIKKDYYLTKSLAINVDKYVRLINFNLDEKDFKNAKKQMEIYLFLKKREKVLEKDILIECKATKSSLKALEKKKIIEYISEDVFREAVKNVNYVYEKPILNALQKGILKKIIFSKDNHFLLRGVTGSGKTEIYLNLAEDFLKKGKDVIILVPEISLTPQTIKRFSGRFKEKIAIIHSKLTLRERFDQWKLIKKGECHLVIGARSAIFAPVNNLGLVIIDEEHEYSYISEQNPKYDTREIAYHLTKKDGRKLVLGSATPDIVTMYDGYLGKYELCEMDERIGNKNLPEVEIINMRDEMAKGNFSPISQKLKKEIDKRLKKKEQVILFLNKRGYTSYLFCKTCGHGILCDNCDVAMTYYKSRGYLICNYCGKMIKKAEQCKFCGSDEIFEYGFGTEKVEEVVKMMFPYANVDRMDRDTTHKKEDYELKYKLMNEGRIDILIGTQMVGKGLDFKNVILVGVILADLSLNIPDFKARERTFQILAQVAGRAGRGDKKGKAVFQTYMPDNFVIKCAAKQDYKSFYDWEIKKREEDLYPPFTLLAVITISGYQMNLTKLKSFEILKYIKQDVIKNKISGIKTSEVQPAVFEKIKNRYRFNIIFKVVNKDYENQFIQLLKDILMENRYGLNFDEYYINIGINHISLV